MKHASPPIFTDKVILPPIGFLFLDVPRVSVAPAETTGKVIESAVKVIA